MSTSAAVVDSRAACSSCLRRSWLLAQLGGPLDCNCRADGRLTELLALEDAQLMKALAGRRRSELRVSHARFRASELARAPGVAEVCRHDRRYPGMLRAPGAPAMLFAAGGLRRLTELTTAPAVAILGTAKATDYGVQIAATLARGLAASGVTVVGGLTDAIARSAQAGALEAAGAVVAVSGAGLDVPAPAHSRALLAGIQRDGVVVSELPAGSARRRWGAAAATRTVAAMAAVSVVVEAEDSARGLFAARIAQAFGRTIAAVPGRVSSRASCGSHALLREGAALVCEAADVLELLYRAGAAAPAPCDRPPVLQGRLQAVLERVGAGLDTPHKLTRAGGDPGELLLALSELELMGLLARGDGGRYVACSPLDAARTALGSGQSDGALTRARRDR